MLNNVNLSEACIVLQMHSILPKKANFASEDVLRRTGDHPLMNSLSSFEALSILQNKLERKIFDLKINKGTKRYAPVVVGHVSNSYKSQQELVGRRALQCWRTLEPGSEDGD